MVISCYQSKSSGRAWAGALPCLWGQLPETPRAPWRVSVANVPVVVVWWPKEYRFIKHEGRPCFVGDCASRGWPVRAQWHRCTMVAPKAAGSVGRAAWGQREHFAGYVRRDRPDMGRGPIPLSA